ncbi:uncharacterized protein [Parasteatoda tepidariorum]|uniref:uncharacterized protein isoform X2 n=1 Tax=Parasteatoda tepidariorum TaxID=114398 RepID=UPI001C71D194|nr:uncharacterized protein LOC107440682 isoform X2 [Parasteatoda tepidariorum]
MGIREESGHFGLWRLCSTTRGTESCVHPDDSPLQLPTHAAWAGALSLIHLFLIASFVVLAIIRVIQVFKDTPDLYLGTKRLCVVKVGVALTCVVIAISVSILASVGDGTFRQFNVYKGWAFWIQIVIVSVDIVMLLVCAFENIQYWQIRMVEPPQPDPTDVYPETFISPDYETFEEPRKVVYVKDASVQSGDSYLQVPDYHARKNQRMFEDTDNRGKTVIVIQDSPHPRKKTVRPTQVI